LPYCCFLGPAVWGERDCRSALHLPAHGGCVSVPLSWHVWAQTRSSCGRADPGVLQLLSPLPHAPGSLLPLLRGASRPHPCPQRISVPYGCPGRTLRRVTSSRTASARGSRGARLVGKGPLGLGWSLSPPVSAAVCM